SAYGNSGAISGATWPTQGRYGNALTFDGTNDWVTVADVPSLDLTSALTMEAWVYPTFSSDWRTVLMKEPAAYYLYSAARNGTTPNLPALGLALGGSYQEAFGPSA